MKRLREFLVTFNVSNNEADTFQSMPVEVTIKSFAGVSSKDIKVSANVKKRQIFEIFDFATFR